jgi:glycosyltransferase involved in cell wall biosynthesis
VTLPVKNRIAFIKIGSFSHVNDKVTQALVEHFPNFKIDVIDIGDLIRNNKIITFINMFFVLKEYGWEILLGKKKIKGCLGRTTYIFKRIKRLISERLSKDEYEFSFQTQSLFDGSIRGLPHYVYTDHTHLAKLHYPDFKKEDLYSPQWVEFERTIYENATLNFTMGINVAKSIVEDYACSQSKVVCVNVGSNVGTDFKLDRAKYNNKNILFVGVDWERKGGPDLVEAFKLVLKVHPAAQLTIVGCSPILNIPNCDVVGRVSLEKVNQYYEKASVFCLPTRLEPFGIVFLEALAHGLPVVATEIGAIPGFVLNNKTGYLVKPGDIEHLSKVLIELIENPEKCLTLGENGRRLVLEKYTWDKVGAEIAKHIKNTVKSSH